jgi:hypothetical protein
VHDTVQAVVRDAAFRRSTRQSLADQLLIWLMDAFDKLGRLFKRLPSGRSLGLALVGLVVLFVLVRLVIAARRRDDTGERLSAGRDVSSTGDPWLAADALAAQGRYDEAAHALYRGVIVSLGRDERVRLDPSKTSGDYARELRRRGSVSLVPFREFTRRFDIAVYGHAGADAGALQELRALSAPFRSRARAA